MKKLIALPVNPSEKGVVYDINQAYVNYVAMAGFQPFLVAPQNNPKDIAKLCHGLLLPGGRDIDPIFYGQNNWHSWWCDPDKDDFERKLFRAFADAGKRVFGICRGHQLVAREYLHQCPDDETKVLEYCQDIDDHSQSQSLFRRVASHYVEVHAKLIYGPEASGNFLTVNSMHHQALLVNKSHEEVVKSPRLTKHMFITAWTDRGIDADDDGKGLVVEGFVLRGWTKAPIMCVQWHPEELKDKNLLANFFNEVSISEKAPVKKVAARKG